MCGEQIENIWPLWCLEEFLSLFYFIFDFIELYLFHKYWFNIRFDSNPLNTYLKWKNWRKKLWFTLTFWVLTMFEWISNQVGLGHFHCNFSVFHLRKEIPILLWLPIFPQCEHSSQAVLKTLFFPVSKVECLFTRSTHIRIRFKYIYLLLKTTAQFGIDEISKVFFQVFDSLLHIVDFIRIIDGRCKMSYKPWQTVLVHLIYVHQFV